MVLFVPTTKTLDQISQLASHPRSRVLERGYINVYSELHPNERRALEQQRLYKRNHPSWDNTSIRLCQEFTHFLDSFHKHSTDLPVILDAGCGHGNYVIDEFRSQIGWACGVDVDPTATTRNVCLDEITHAPLESLPYPDSSFDAVLGLWVLEHLTQPLKVLREIRRVLKPGGLFIFCTPNRQSLLVATRRLLGSRLGDIVNRRVYGRKSADVFPVFYRANDPRELAHLLEAAGFSSSKIIRNYDPGYTSFNPITFAISNLFEASIGLIAPALSRPHLVGHAVS